MEGDDVLLEADNRMSKAIDVMLGEMKTIRTGRANPALVENLKVEYYGTPTPLKQLAQISTPDPRTLVVKPFDPSSLSDIDKAIRASDLGLNPGNDGKLLRISIPPLSEERRKSYADLARKAGENAKVKLRNVRRDANRRLDQLEKEKQISEDQKFRLREQLQKSLDEYEKKVEDLVKRKEKEILEV